MNPMAPTPGFNPAMQPQFQTTLPTGNTAPMALPPSQMTPTMPSQMDPAIMAQLGGMVPPDQFMMAPPPSTQPMAAGPILDPNQPQVPGASAQAPATPQPSDAEIQAMLQQALGGGAMGADPNAAAMGMPPTGVEAPLTGGASLYSGPPTVQANPDGTISEIGASRPGGFLGALSYLNPLNILKPREFGRFIGGLATIVGVALLGKSMFFKKAVQEVAKEAVEHGKDAVT